MSFPPGLLSSDYQKVANLRGERRFRDENMHWAPDVHLLVAYAEVVNTHSWVGYERRYWWLRSYDKDVYPDGNYATGHPCEAVDPLSIEVNRESEPIPIYSRSRDGDNLITEAVQNEALLVTVGFRERFKVLINEYQE